MPKTVLFRSYRRITVDGQPGTELNYNLPDPVDLDLKLIRDPEVNHHHTHQIGDHAVYGRMALYRCNKLPALEYIVAESLGPRDHYLSRKEKDVIIASYNIVGLQHMLAQAAAEIPQPTPTLLREMRIRFEAYMDAATLARIDQGG